MQIIFLDKNYEELYYGTKRLNFHPDLIKKFRMRIDFMCGIENIDKLYKMTSLHCENLLGDKKGIMSIRLNKQWRLLFKVLQNGEIQVLGIIGIKDYH